MTVEKEQAPLLPRGQLLAISVYWFGINALWGGYEIFGQQRVEEFVGTAARGATISNIEFLVALVAIAVQPTVGSISDYTQSRWGRRKPFILIGGLLDVVAIFALATADTLLAFTAFLLLLSFTSNFAQGPFQGYVPDLVPDRQVNVAGAVVGLMRLLGVIIGSAIVATGASSGDFATPLVVIGVIEATLAVVTVLTVREGPAARPRDGRGWLSIAREAWALDALHERSFIYMTLTRLMFLAGPAIFVNVSLYYMEGSMRLTGDDLRLWLTLGPATIGIGTVIGTASSAWAARRVGRKPVAWAAAALAALGIVLLARAPEPIQAVPGLLLLGLGSGMYIAVDWALMTSTIPRISSGRYMGLGNIANSLAGPIGLIVAGRVLDAVTASAGLDAGPRVASLIGLIFLGAAALLLIPVRPRVEPPGDQQLATGQVGAT